MTSTWESGRRGRSRRRRRERREEDYGLLGVTECGELEVLSEGAEGRGSSRFNAGNSLAAFDAPQPRPLFLSLLLRAH